MPQYLLPLPLCPLPPSSEGGSACLEAWAPRLTPAGGSASPTWVGPLSFLERMSQRTRAQGSCAPTECGSLSPGSLANCWYRWSSTTSQSASDHRSQTSQVLNLEQGTHMTHIMWSLLWSPFPKWVSNPLWDLHESHFFFIMTGISVSTK